MALGLTLQLMQVLESGLKNWEDTGEASFFRRSKEYGGVIVEKTMNERWLSNTYLVADKEGGHGFIIDTGGPWQPIVEQVERLRLTITHVLNTHHHIDHVLENERYQELYQVPIGAHACEQARIRGCDLSLAHGDALKSGGLDIKVLHIPGHTDGQLAFLVEGVGCFTGDTLFAGSVGGTKGPGHTSFEDIQSSIMERLMSLAPETVVYPGHTEATSIGQEWQHNPFIQMWRGLKAREDRDCEVSGQRATLRLLARDYDGGTKAWVYFPEAQEEAIVPGSRVKVLES